MSQFIFLSHLDTFAATATLVKHRNRFDWNGVLALGWDMPAPIEGAPPAAVDLAEWGSMRRLLDHAREVLTQRDETYHARPLAWAHIARLERGDATHTLAAESPHPRFIVPLVTNPGCFEFGRSGPVHIETGVLTLRAPLDMTLSANWGTSPRYHLVFEFAQAVEVPHEPE